MTYRLIVHRPSGTASVHAAASQHPRCQPRTGPGYEFATAETPRDVAQLVFREGLKLVPCPECPPLPT